MGLGYPPLRSQSLTHLSAKALWTALDQLNQSLAQTLLHLSRLHDADPEGYASAVKYISSLQAVQVRALRPPYAHLADRSISPAQWLANPFTPTDEAPVISTFYEAHRITEVRFLRTSPHRTVPLLPAIHALTYLLLRTSAPVCARWVSCATCR